MPKATMEDEPKWKLPKETPFPAILKAVKEREIKYVNKKGESDSFFKWEWEFEIIGGEYAGLRAWGDTEDRLTNRDDNKVRQWAETLTGRSYDLGEGLDTDDLLGLECVITVDNTEYQKKDGSGGISYLTPVVDVFPADSVPQSDEPPF